MRINPKHSVATSLSPPPVEVSPNKTQQLSSKILSSLPVSLQKVALPREEQSILVFDSLQLCSVEEFNGARFYHLDLEGNLSIAESDIHLAVMILIGNTIYFRENCLEQIQNQYNKGHLGDIDLNKMTLVPVSEELWSTLLISLACVTSFLNALETKDDSTKTQKMTPKLDKSTKSPKSELQKSFIATFKTTLEKFLKSQLTQLLIEQRKDEKAAQERHERKEIAEEIDKKSQLVKHEIRKYEQLLTEIKTGALKKDHVIDGLQNWVESLPPCALREVNTLILWRNLKPTLMQLMRHFYTKLQAERLQGGY